ncbi:MAG TPA: hypothetical protein PLO70_16080, partial [Chitinophagaceae bacterium]|nr:hypothetical protein [Chitinophagaceae bacterium]
LSYVLSYAEVSVIIPGIRTKEHVKGNTSGLFQLESDDMKLIEKMGASQFMPIMDMILRQG